VTRLKAIFEELRRGQSMGLIAYLPVGYPSLAATPALVQAVVEGGADVVELGIPFSDPVADGVSIQQATHAALQEGASVVRALEVARECRQRTAVGLVFMTYYNPLLAYGEKRFATDSAAAGVDGVIVIDLPPAEAESWGQAARAVGLDTVFLVAPTSSPDRIDAAARASSGFLYCVTLTGTTGARTAVGEEAFALLRQARAGTQLPLAAGFGISRPEHVQALRGHSDAVVIGSALVDAIKSAGAQAVPGAARALMAELKAGVRA
jgi:tryptophan synthase alpha chain